MELLLFCTLENYRGKIMPAGFEKCRSGGGKIRTKDLGNGKYMHICILNGKLYPGEVKTKKESSGSATAEAIRGMKP
jgi:hypothetical protein